MSKSNKKNDFEINKAPVTKVKKYTFGEAKNIKPITNKETDQETKKNQIDKEQKQNKNYKKAKRKNYKKPKKKKTYYKPKDSQLASVQTVESLRKDNQRLEKEILLDINSIQEIEIE
ncbi:MAG TPA: hypothetical protein VFD28_04410 [Candidatus Eisenbacteria bacterium]|nr:hypothetical protein [Candidatus Eisenbacteria bacterium]